MPHTFGFCWQSAPIKASWAALRTNTQPCLPRLKRVKLPARKRTEPLDQRGFVSVRKCANDRLSPGGGVHAACHESAAFGAAFSFGRSGAYAVPVPTLEFNSIDLLRVAWASSAAAAEDFVTRGPTAFTSATLVAVVFSAAAVEAFTNDLADHVEVWRTAGSWAFNATTPELIRATAAMLDVEAQRQRNQITAKVRAATRALANDPTMPDNRRLQDLRRLIVLRDAVMHARAPRPPRPGLEETLADLARDGLTLPVIGRANAFLRMQSPRVALWAYRTAYLVIHSMLDQVPSEIEAVDSLRDTLRNPIKIPPPRNPLKIPQP